MLKPRIQEPRPGNQRSRGPIGGELKAFRLATVWKITAFSYFNKHFIQTPTERDFFVLANSFIRVWPEKEMSDRKRRKEK